MRCDWFRTHTGKGQVTHTMEFMMTSSRSKWSCAWRGLDRQRGRAGWGVRGSGIMTLPQGSCG